MNNIVHVQYKQTGQSKSNNALGMRQMQERAFEYRDAQYKRRLELWKGSANF